MSCSIHSLAVCVAGDAHVLEGHAFIVEAAVSIGGRDIKPGINTFRFANRIPLLFEVSTGLQCCHLLRFCCALVGDLSERSAIIITAPAGRRSRASDAEKIACEQGGSDVITKTALKRITWPAYKISPTSDKVGVFVSIVSTKIPYKGAGKEYIGELAFLEEVMVCSCCPAKLLLVQDQVSRGEPSVRLLTDSLRLAADDMQEMVHAVKQSIQQCCLQVCIHFHRF